MANRHSGGKNLPVKASVQQAAGDRPWGFDGISGSCQLYLLLTVNREPLQSISTCNRFSRVCARAGQAWVLHRRCSTREIWGGVALRVQIAHSHQTVAIAPQHISRSNRVGQMAFLRPMRTRGMPVAHYQNLRPDSSISGHPGPGMTRFLSFRSLGRLRYVSQIPAVFV